MSGTAQLATIRILQAHLNVAQVSLVRKGVVTEACSHATILDRAERFFEAARGRIIYATSVNRSAPSPGVYREERSPLQDCGG